MGLAKKTAKGIIWAYAAFFGGRILTLISTAILARLLGVRDFGLIGFALVVMAFIEVSRGFGINQALIYTDEKFEEAADTAFIANIVISIFQTLLLILAAPLALKFFDDERIVLIIRVMAFTFLFNGLGQTHDAILQKEMEFRRRFVPDLLSSVIKGIVSIGLALSGYGVWSLVVGHLVGAASRTLAKWWVLRWMPSFRFHMDRARALWDYGVHILAFELLNVTLEQADQLLIGTLLGTLQLGYYAVAAKIPEMVIANFTIVLTSVIFPAFSKVKNDTELLTKGFLATTKYTAYVTVPAGIGMAAVAPELVRLFYGEKWEPAILLLQVLSLLGMMATLPWSAGDVLKAIGRPDISTKMLALEALYTFPLIILFVNFSRLAVMASLANLISLTITAVFRLLVISHFLNLKPTIFLRIFRSPFASAGVMYGVIYGWRHLVDSLPTGLVLISSIILGGLVYVGVMWLLERDEILQAKEMVTDLMSSRKKDTIDALAQAELETSELV